MKKIVLIICLLCPLFVHAQKDSGTRFSKAKNWNEVLNEAREANRPIFLDLYTTWCPPCARIEKEVFTDPKVAAFINTKFIAVRVQMDTTTKDNDYVKGWRKDATKWIKYAPAFPTFLFYTADGVYSGRESGFHVPDEFLALLKKAVDPKDSYLNQVAGFRNGQLTQQQLLELAYLAKDNKEDSIAYQVAKVYKGKYIDPLPVDSLLNKEADRFHATFINIFSFKDKIIQYIYEHPDITDVKFERWPEYSKNLTEYVISRDYISKELFSKQTPAAAPNWTKIEKSIARDFNRVLAKRLVLSSKIGWLYQRKDYRQAADLEFKRIEEYGLDTTLMGRANINNIVYEIAFKYVEDKEVLKKALSIMERVLELDKGNSSGHYDTYAGILYKIGEKTKALAAENKAVEIATRKNNPEKVKFYKDVISKMELDIPIWK